MKFSCIALPVIVAFCSIRMLAADNAMSALLDEDTNDWNNIVDALVGPLTEEIRKSIANVVTIPNINETFNEQIIFTNIEGTANAFGGTLVDVESIERVGEAKFRADGSSYLLSCPFDVKVTKFQFKNYSASVEKLHVQGSMTGSIEIITINLTMKVSVDDDKKCTGTLHDLEIIKFEDMTVSLTGFGPFNRIASYIANSQIEKQTVLITNMLQAGIRGAITTEINKWNGRFTLDEFLEFIRELLE